MRAGYLDQRVGDRWQRGGAQIVPRPNVWSQVDTAPWGHVNQVDCEDIRSVVDAQGRPLEPQFDGARHAAVLVVLAPGARGMEVLLTRRSQHLRQHRGEMSFPGGKMDAGETPEQTALREAHEEVGLDPAVVEVIGELSHVNTAVSLSYIIPKVAVIEHPIPLQPQTGEADRVMWVPLDDLLQPGVYHGELWGTPPTERLLHFFELSDETVWGATGRMLADLFCRLFPHH